MTLKNVGYGYLNEHYKLLLPTLNIEVVQDPSATTESVRHYGSTKCKVLPGRIKDLDTPYENMVAAIKHQGIRLHYFAPLFRVINVAEFSQFIALKPQAKYHRVLWFLYEWLTAQRLDIADLKSGNYQPLFDDK